MIVVGEKKHTSDRARSAKILLRERVLEEIGVDKAKVFDAFAGPGAMHAAVWSRARSYTGCDLRWYQDKRRVFVGDNLAVMRSIDLCAFNVFDFDAFGSPWKHMSLLAKRRELKTGETSRAKDGRKTRSGRDRRQRDQAQERRRGRIFR